MAKKQTQEHFINISNLLHNYKYDYSKMCYVNNNTLIIIICPIHGEFKQRPRSHSIEGKGCFKCGKLEHFYSTNEFILAAQKNHGKLFDYSKAKYSHSWNKIKINCLKHGEFEQRAANHLAGTGCPTCGINKKKLNTSLFISKAQQIHNCNYNYSKVNYINAHSLITIICLKHGEFQQLPHHHLSNHGCIKCSSSISKLEIKWLDSLNIPNNYRQVTLKINDSIFKVDAFDHKKNIIYEFYGDFWHGNPKVFKLKDINSKTKCTFGELYDKTIKRENLLKAAGYSIIKIWQSDFYENFS